MKPTPESAAVRPRVVQVAPVRGPGTAAVLLEEQIRAHCAAGRRGYVWIEGGPGAGKTTALAHLAAVLRDQPALALLDEPDRSELDAELNRGMLVVYASSGTAGVPHVTRYELVVWTADDWIEYLLARHRSECASVMARVRKAADVDLPAGNPELCAMILDELAADESIGDVTSALRRCLERVFAGRRAAIAARAALGMLAHTRTLESAELVQLSRRIGKPAMRLLRHAPVQRLLATDLAVRQFRAGKSCKWLAHRLPADLVTAVAAVIRADPEVQQHLAALFARRKPALQPMLASLLTAARPEWKPQPGEAISLAAAHLRGVQWAGVDLTGCSLQAADLRDADLRDARLDRARAERTLLAHAVLHGALLHELRAGFASLAGADLSFARARAGQFEGADLRGANLEGALLADTRLGRANLEGARLIRADLRGADLEQARLQDADFSAANLERAALNGLDLSQAEFIAARFVQARLRGAKLCGVRLPAADFSGAHLQAADLTAAYMPGAVLRDADLTNTGLADVDWERADLRDADLRGASFHMGSARSGLVHSPLACEGSRTGFYTDEFDEQTYRAPEDIRKANLRGADLRGAAVLGVDFYLVDLRDARYDPVQAQHFRRCGAILAARV